MKIPLGSKPTVIILYGGGLDSASLAIQAISQAQVPLLLYCDYGAKAAYNEKSAMSQVGNRLQVPVQIITVPPAIRPHSLLSEGVASQEQSKNEVPGRNMLFMSLGISLAFRLGINAVWIGADRPMPGNTASEFDGFLDTKPAFIAAFNQAVLAGYGPRSPQVYAPLLSYRDSAIYYGAALREMPDLLDIAYSCYEEERCGVCSHCKRNARLRSLLLPATYAAP